MQIWKKLTDGLKNDSKNLANFHQSTWKDQNWDFDGIILPTIKIHELKIYRGVICNDTEERWNIWGRIYLLFQNWHEGFDEFWYEHLKVSKRYTSMSSFWPKYVIS